MTQNIKNIGMALTIQALAIITILSLFQPLNALEIYNPASTCNEKQAKIMTNKCDKLDDKAYELCESETMKAFFKCVKGAKND